MKTTTKTIPCGFGRIFAKIPAFARAAALAAAFVAMPAGAESVWRDAYIRIDGASDLNGDGLWTPNKSSALQDETVAESEIPDSRHGALATYAGQRLLHGSSDSGVISRSGARIANKDVVMTSCGGRTVNMPVIYFPQTAYNGGNSLENIYLDSSTSPISGNEWTVLLRCRHEAFISSAVAYVFGVKTTNLGGQKEIRLGWGNNPWNTSDTKRYVNVVLGGTRRALTNIEAKPGKWVELSMVVKPSAPVDLNGTMTITNCIRISSAYEGETRLYRDLEVPYDHSQYTTNFTPAARWTCFGGIRYGNLTSNLDGFRGDIQLFGLWNRALSDAEVCEAFGGGSPNLFRIGEENCTAEMFGGAAPASGTTVTLDPLQNDKRGFPTVLASGATFRIPFAVDKYSADTAHWLRFKAQTGSAAGTVAASLDGTPIDPVAAYPGGNSYVWIPGERFTSGDHVLALSRTDDGGGAVKFDVIELGGAICAGVADGSESDMGSAGATADNAYFDYDTWFAADGNLMDFVRNTANSKTGNHRPTTIVWDLPSGAAGKFGMQFSYKFLYSTADSGGNEPLEFRVNGTLVNRDENPSATNKTVTVFKVDAEGGPFVDGRNTIEICFPTANKNNWVDWDMLKIEPVRPKMPFVLVVR